MQTRLRKYSPRSSCWQASCKNSKLNCRIRKTQQVYSLKCTRITSRCTHSSNRTSKTCNTNYRRPNRRYRSQNNCSSRWKPNNIVSSSLRSRKLNKSLNSTARGQTLRQKSIKATTRCSSWRKSIKIRAKYSTSTRSLTIISLNWSKQNCHNQLLKYQKQPR